MQNHDLHVVLGATGTMGQAVVAELKRRNLKIRAVQRRPGTDDIETAQADLMNIEQTTAALQDASYVYLCVAIPYNTKQWQAEWPTVMDNVLTACETVKARLVFLDNIYMYGPAPLKHPFDETHSQNPLSEKGKVRKTISDKLLEAHRTGRIQAVIGRSADFYGYSSSNMLYISFLENMLKGKAPQALARTDIPHTYSFTEDNGRALVALALDDSTYGQVWHLPVSRAVTVNEINQAFNRQLGTNFKISVVPRFMTNLLGLFVPPIKEMQEMMYQFDNPYIMNSNKFMKHFPDFKVTEFDDGIKDMVAYFR